MYLKVMKWKNLAVAITTAAATACTAALNTVATTFSGATQAIRSYFKTGLDSAGIISLGTSAARQWITIAGAGA